MQPQKANKIMEAVDSTLPKRQLRSNLMPTMVEEQIPSGETFTHTGFGIPSKAEGEPGEDIAVKVHTKLSPLDRLRDPARYVLHSEGETTRVLGAIAELGYSYDPDSESPRDPNTPQLEQVQDPEVHYDGSIDRIVTTVHFKDHNPRQ